MRREIPADERSTPRRGRPRKPRQVGVILDGDMYRQLERLAVEDGRPVSGMVRKILKVALDDLPSHLWTDAG